MNRVNNKGLPSGWTHESIRSFHGQPISFIKFSKCEQREEEKELFGIVSEGEGTSNSPPGIVWFLPMWLFICSFPLLFIVQSKPNINNNSSSFIFAIDKHLACLFFPIFLSTRLCRCCSIVHVWIHNRFAMHTQIVLACAHVVVGYLSLANDTSSCFCTYVAT